MRAPLVCALGLSGVRHSKKFYPRVHFVLIKLDIPASRVHNVYMKRVISLKRLREFWDEHPDAETPLKDWYRVAKHAEWKSIHDVRKTYPAADAVEADSGTTMAVFNIGGNKYRLITNIWYEGQQVYIKMVLTHAEYSKNKWKKQL